MIDVLIAGGGPAGLATALYAAQRGLEAVVVEPRAGVIDKACGEGLMPAAVQRLAALGATPARSHPFAGIRYVQGDLSCEGRFRGGVGLGVRRLALHQALLAAVERAGIRRVEGRVSEFRQHADHVAALGLQARWGVAADGLYSPIRRGLGLDLPARLPPRVGLRRHFRVQPWSDFVEVHWADDVEAYVTPVADDEVGIALLVDRGHGSPDHQTPFDRYLSRFPALRARLGEPTSTVRGAGPFEHRTSRRVAGRVLLVGDAAGYLDPLTGEGIRLGLLSAEALVGALAAGDPARYEADWRRLAGPTFRMTAALLWAARTPWIRRRMVAIPRRVPWIFGAILNHLAG